MKARKKFTVVAYDISSTRKRNKVAKILEDYGVRVNLSVFECMFSKRQLETIKITINEMINPKTDIIVYYVLCIDCFVKINRFPEEERDCKEVLVK